MLQRAFFYMALATMAPICGSAQSRSEADDRGISVHINLFHPPGAECTFRRSGAPLDVRKNKSTDPNIGYEEDWIDISNSHADVTVTCRMADGWQESRTLIYGPSTLTNFLAACTPSKKEGQPCIPGVRESTATVYEYLPGFIRMQRTDPAAMQGL
jgi:hypothetical protein